MVENHWRINGNSFWFGFLQTPACFQKKQAGVCSTSGYVFKKAGGMFFDLFFLKFYAKIKSYPHSLTISYI